MQTRVRRVIQFHPNLDILPILMERATPQMKRLGKYVTPLALPVCPSVQCINAWPFFAKGNLFAWPNFESVYSNERTRTVIVTAGVVLD
jgi:hypothetical protein